MPDRDEEGRLVCNKPCPEHGDKCSVTNSTKDEQAMIKMMLGAKSGFKGHTHLCLGVEGKPHGWRD